MAKNKANKHYVLSLDTKIIANAENSCLRRGTTLRRKIEDTIIAESKIKVSDHEALIPETQLTAEIWAPSRSTLYSMRNSGELAEGTHFITNEGLIFYRLKAVREHFKKNYPQIEQANRRRTEPVTG